MLNKTSIPWWPQRITPGAFPESHCLVQGWLSISFWDLLVQRPLWFLLYSPKRPSHPAHAFFIGISTTEAVKLNRYLLSDSQLCLNSQLNPTWPLSALSHTLNVIISVHNLKLNTIWDTSHCFTARMEYIRGAWRMILPTFFYPEV